MTAHPDLDPAATRMIRLVAGVPDDALGNPTPCVEGILGLAGRDPEWHAA